MSSLSTYAKTAFMRHIADIMGEYTAPEHVYLCLCTADPTAAGTGASQHEVPDALGYERKLITFSAASGRSITQNNAIWYSKPIVTYGDVTHWSIVDSPTYGSGNMLAYGELSETVSMIAYSRPCYIDPGEVVIGISTESGKGLSNYLVHSLLNMMFRGVAYTYPDTYLAILIVEADDETATVIRGVNECDKIGYSRQEIGKFGTSSPQWEEVSSCATQNDAAVSFTGISFTDLYCEDYASDLVIDYSSDFLIGYGSMAMEALGIVDVYGNLLYYDNTATLEALADGDVVRFVAGAIDLAFS